MADFRFGGREYEAPATTFRVMHEIERAWATRWSKLTDAQRSIGMLWFAARADNPGLTPEAMLDLDIEELIASPLEGSTGESTGESTPEGDGLQPSASTSA